MPVTYATLLIYVPVVVGMALTPGPDALFVLSRSIVNGPTAGIATALGTCAGLYLYAAAVGLGLAGVFDYSPLAYNIIRIVGIAYLLYLAWQCFRTPNTLPTAHVASANRSPARASWAKFFLQGVLNDLTNPKAVLFFIALFPQFLEPAQGDLLGQAIFLNTIGNALNMMVLSLIAIGAGRLGRWRARNPRIARLQQWLVGCIFVGLAARLAVTGRQS